MDLFNRILKTGAKDDETRKEESKSSKKFIVTQDVINV